MFTNDTPRPTTATIPGRLAPKRPRTSFTSRSFNSTANRFDSSEITDIPGVGRYNVNNYSMTKSSPSVSKKGYGCLASKKEKLTDLYPRSDTPGPGAYRVKMLPAGRQIQFTSTGKNGRQPYDMPELTPGPYDYKIKLDITPQLLKNKPSYFMCSKSGRQSFLAAVSDAPGVNKYQLPDEFQDPKKTSFQWSKSTWVRFRDIGVDNKVPPSTKYFSSNEFICAQQKGTRPYGKFKVKFLGKQNDSRSAALHTFGADKDRFKHSFCGNLAEKAELPGPNAYQLCFDQIEGTRAQSPPGGVFKSKAPLRGDPVKYGVPSPLHYNPSYPKKSAQCTNTDGRWI